MRTDGALLQREDAAVADGASPAPPGDEWHVGDEQMEMDNLAAYQDAANRAFPPDFSADELRLAHDLDRLLPPTRAFAAVFAADIIPAREDHAALDPGQDAGLERRALAAVFGRLGLAVPARGARQN